VLAAFPSWPRSFQPQQNARPSAPTRQLCTPPAAILTRDVGGVTNAGALAASAALELEAAGACADDFAVGCVVVTAFTVVAPLVVDGWVEGDGEGFTGSAAKRTSSFEAATPLGGIATGTERAVSATGCFVVSAAGTTEAAGAGAAAVVVYLTKSPDADTGSVGDSANRDASFARTRIAVPITAKSATPSNAPPAYRNRLRGGVANTA